MIDWSQVDTVLLDMDGTLLDLHYDNFFWLHYLPQRYAAAHAIDEAEARERLIALFEAQRGNLNWYCVDYWSDALSVDIAALKAEIRHLIAIRPYTQAFLRWLQQGPQRVLLVTNAHRKSLDLKMQQTGIGEYFDALVCSHDYGSPKEGQAFWRRLQQEHPFDATRTLFIDDSAPVLAAAERFGIRYLLTLLQPDSRLAPREVVQYPGFHHFDELVPQLRALGVVAGDA
jgi:HAD superfamily hydrolase (TIGR01509 family)